MLSYQRRFLVVYLTFKAMRRPRLVNKQFEVLDCWRRLQTITETGTPTTLTNTIIDEQIQKKIVNGQLLIIRDGKEYNTIGAEIK